MFQVLFHVPFTAGPFPPDGWPVPGFGAMLFLSFVLTAMVWGPVRAVLVGLPKDKLQDLAVWLFVFGIAGARVLYMLQFPGQFPAQTVLGKLREFVQIWNGGIVVYGAVFGGLIGYAGFYHLVMRRFNVSGWKLADAVAPLIAAGMAVGRIGCYLNGCCWGQPVAPPAQTVPLAAELGQFPLLPAHAREQVCRPGGGDRPEVHGLQTSTGFTVEAPPPAGLGDPRSVVLAVEPGSQAERAGLQKGDRVVTFDGRPNAVVLELIGGPAETTLAADKLAAAGGAVRSAPADASARVAFDTPDAYRAAAPTLAQIRADGIAVAVGDDLGALVRDAARGRGELRLGVDRAGAVVPVTFTPRTVPFFPTQLYETVSMALLVVVLLAFQPLRRHDGQMMVILMLGYAGHRFLNEALRLEPTYALGLTLSQWISVGIAAAALGLELFLRLTRPKLPPGPLPLGYGATPAAAEAKPPAVPAAA